MNSPIITVENLSKRYSLSHLRDQRYVALRDVLVEKATGLFRRNGKSGGRPSDVGGQTKEDFWALKDVSFEVKEGEVVGIIGRNGAGKSTLLKILSRITDPTEGRIQIKGRVASLLEVGTGFHPELTGRENIFLNGAILGMQRAEIRKKFDEIVAFAEVEKFLDTPVKRYSSGMYVRLAFAVAAHLEPEILVVDEVLAVGDAEFQKKCLGKIESVAKGEGRTVLFVSHNMQTIQQLCNRALLLSSGKKTLDGAPSEVVEAYRHDRNDAETGLSEISRIISELPEDPTFRFRKIEVSQLGRITADVVSGEPIQILIEYDVLEEAHGLHVYFLVCDLDGLLLFESLHNGALAEIPSVGPGRYRSTAIIPADLLAGRTYELQINVGIHRVRTCVPQPSPLRIALNVTSLGQVNRAYPGYLTPGKLAPLIPWETSRLGSDECSARESKR
jgi:lipopolysaccharide transport system ATP-binding protein